MSIVNRCGLPGFFAALLLLAAPVCKANVIDLTFTGINNTYPDRTSLVLLQDYYKGGAASNGAIGPNYGVTFSGNATLLCLNTTLGQCSGASKGGGAGSQFWAMTFATAIPVINVAPGFTKDFSMTYSNPTNAAITVQIWSDFFGFGTLLASQSLGATPLGAGINGCFGATFCPFSNFSLEFAGTAHSVLFTGPAVLTVFDDITLDVNQVGGAVPEPRTFSLFSLGLSLAGIMYRRNKTKV